jgi:hypothetical protein
MSRSNAAAINRRVNMPTANQGGNIKPVSATSINQLPPSNMPQTSGFTLPQVISLIDTRLVTLEKFMRESKENPLTNQVSNSDYNQNNIQYNIQEKQNFTAIESVSVNDFNTIINEFNSRFELFAHEISEMKDIVLKLQSYTMDVNKTLLEERNHVYSDLSNNQENSIQEDNNLANTNEISENQTQAFDAESNNFECSN